MIPMKNEVTCLESSVDENSKAKCQSQNRPFTEASESKVLDIVTARSPNTIRYSMKTNSLSLLLFATCTRCGQAKKHVRPTKNDFLVTDLVDIEPVFDAFQGEMYAGLLPIDPFDDKIQPSDDAGHLMFWYFHAEERIVEDSLVIWFNGGPGCSSFSAGLSFEIVSRTVLLRFGFLKLYTQ